MPTDEKTPPVEKTPDSYELLIEKINTMEKKIEEQTKKIEEVTKMNRALLNGNSEPTTEKKDDKKELEERLIKGLKR